MQRRNEKGQRPGKRAEPPHVSEEATPFNSPCLCRFYLAGYAVSTMQAAPFIPGGFGKGISF
ncbi:hypothetical protein NXY28_24920 [Bacteroides thetaiotaomicron]|nr:hypothetical protein NXY28_24920 [Bacteroides thetaiotaomicron]